MLSTFYQLRRIIRKKERMEGRNGRFELNTLFSTALVDKTCTICWHSRANGTWQNKLRLPPFFGSACKKKTLVFAPSTSLILPHGRVLCTKMNFRFARNILGIINLLWIRVSNNLRILDNSTKREKIQKVDIE